VVAGNIDTAKLRAKNDELIKIGVWFCKQYQKKFPESQKFMQVIIDHADSMKSISLAEIEELWHDNGIFSEAGNEVAFDVEDEDYEHLMDPKE